MNKKITKTILISSIPICIAIICIIGVIINNRKHRQQFVFEVKEILTSCENESINNARLHYANHSNRLQTYNGTYTYFIKLDGNKRITYFLIYSDKYAIASISDETYKVEYIDTPKTAIYQIKDANHLQQLTDEYNKILAETEKIEKEKSKDNNAVDEIEKEETEEVEITEENTETTTTDNNTEESHSGTTSPQNEYNPPSQPTVEELTYTIGEPTYYNCERSRGTGGTFRTVTNEIIDGKFTVIITSGIYKHGGYVIEVPKVEITGNNAIITARTRLLEGDAYIQVMNCPKITVSFNKTPDSYKIVDETGNDYINGINATKKVYK